MTIWSKWSTAHPIIGLVQEVIFRSLESVANPHEDIFYETEGQMTGILRNISNVGRFGWSVGVPKSVKVDGHVLHGVWERGGGMCWAIQHSKEWRFVDVSVCEGLGELREEGSQNTRWVSGCPGFLWRTSQVEIGVGPLVAVVRKCHRSKSGDTLPAHASEVVWGSRLFQNSSPVRTR